MSKSVLKVLAANIYALKGERTFEEFKPAGMGIATVHALAGGPEDVPLDQRIARNARIASIAKLAKANDLEAWQLLVPGFDPQNKPALYTRELRIELETRRRFERGLKALQSGGGDDAAGLDQPGGDRSADAAGPHAGPRPRGKKAS